MNEQSNNEETLPKNALEKSGVVVHGENIEMGSASENHEASTGSGNPETIVNNENRQNRDEPENFEVDTRRGDEDNLE